MKHLLQQCLEALQSVVTYYKDGKPKTIGGIASIAKRCDKVIKAVEEELAKDEQISNFENSQEPLGQDFSKVLHDNLWDMYVSDESKPKDEQAPCKKVYLVPTGQVFIDQDTYTRHDVRPPLCDAEVLYTRPAQRQPLSEEEIDELIDITIAEQGHMHDWDMYKFASVIENAVYEKLGIR